MGAHLIVFLALRAGRPVALLPALVARRLRDDVHHPRLAVLRPAQLVQALTERFGGMPRSAARIIHRPLLGAIDRVLLPGLVFTSPFGYASELLLAPDDADHDSTIDALLEAAYRWARTHRLRSLAFLWVGGTQRRLLAGLQRARYTLSAARPTYRLAVPWSHLDQYLASFRSPRRVRFRHEMATFTDGGVTVRRVASWSDIETPAVHLAVALQRRYGGRDSAARLTQRYRRAAEHLARGALHLAAYRGADLVGFLTAFHHAGILYPKFVGFDYAVSETLFVYFNLVYYHLIEQAVALGLRAIHYGPSTDEAKLLRGCTMEPLYCGYRVLVRGTERVVDWYLARLHRETVQRSRKLLATFAQRSTARADWDAAVGWTE